ncbi:ABC transporter permease [Kribbella italica]|uniref:ABC-type transport system involved in multi-copper enzyme maturation permease subunit n=1 Tax=Kribbella italica TaxID=1540520 RepID=A0A7W9J1R1_9ACTN|nr:ABC transporter permease [Kribbella italica]MBB5834037.1 ABC-type transport system involved in multi-copper enzyme maturation permease subunit [Kribbella italica]
MSAVAAVRSQLRFVDLLRSEWTKLRSLPSVWWTLLAMVVFSTAITLLVCGGDQGRYSALSPGDQLAWDPTALSLNSFFMAQLCISVLGILVVTSEYATGTIRTSLSAMPRRGWLLAAKTLVFAAVALLAGQLTSFVAFLAGQAMLDRHHGSPTAALTDPEVLTAVSGTGLYLAAVGLLAVAVGTLTRATAGGLAVQVGITLLVPAFGGALPSWAQQAFAYWPSLGGPEIRRLLPTPEYPDAWTNLAGMTAGIAVVLVVASVVFRRREV